MSCREAVGDLLPVLHQGWPEPSAPCTFEETALSVACEFLVWLASLRVSARRRQHQSETLTDKTKSALNSAFVLHRMALPGSGPSAPSDRLCRGKPDSAAAVKRGHRVSYLAGYLSQVFVTLPYTVLPRSITDSLGLDVEASLPVCQALLRGTGR